MQPQLPADLLDIIANQDNRIGITEKNLTNDAVPIGAEFDWPALQVSKLPWNYKVADGSAIDRIAYSGYFALVGTDYGVGDGSATFNMPTITIPSNANKIAAYNEFTSSVSINTTTEGTAVTVITSSSVTCNGTDKYWIEFFAPYVATGNAGQVFLPLFQDTTAIVGIWGEYSTNAAAQNFSPCLLRRIVTPAAGAHTWTVKGFFSTNGGTVGAGLGGTGANSPGYISVTSAADNTSATHVKIVKVL